MGFLSSSARAATPSGPSAEELRLEKQSKQRIAKAEADKKEARLQRLRGLRGHRSLLSPKNTGAGFQLWEEEF
jgi:hypothetical protein